MKEFEKFTFPEEYRAIAENYVDYKHSLGFRYPVGEQRKLDYLLSFVYNHSSSEPKYLLTRDLVEEYAAGKPEDSKRYLHSKQSTVRQFALFLNLMGIPAYVYPKDLVKTANDFVPYIFTPDEIRRIIDAADAIQPNKNKFVNTPLIYPAVIRMLYGCGLRITEVLSLKCTDVDLDNGIIAVMNGKNNVSRLAPMSESLRKYLLQYEAEVIRGGNPYFFPALHNERYSSTTVLAQFKRLEVQADIAVLSNGKHPRIHDLRHTFSVHALEQMIARGQDPYCSLPILSAYLGHKGIESTEKYLRLTKQYFISVLRYSAEVATKIFPEV